MTRGFGGVNVDGVNVLHDPRSCDWKAAMRRGAATARRRPTVTAQQACCWTDLRRAPEHVGS
jgi:hypothetical protein